MLRQIGKPRIFLTVSANEIGWADSLQTLYQFRHNGLRISEDELKAMNFIEKVNLVNEDAVTCALYFNKLVNVLMRLLQSKKFSPFGKYRVCHFFKWIEFQHIGSPHAHILCWLDYAPQDILEKDNRRL